MFTSLKPHITAGEILADINAVIGSVYPRPVNLPAAGAVTPDLHPRQEMLFPPGWG
jgi:hypothetical protein